MKLIWAFGSSSKCLVLLARSPTSPPVLCWAADRQDRFLLLHKELIQGRPQVTESSLIAAAQTAGLEIARLRADMTDSAIGKVIEENQSLAHVLGVSSPALLIGNRIYHGATNLEKLQAAVAQARSQASQ